MDWAAASAAPSWGATAADSGPTMLSFAEPSSYAADAAEARLQDLAASLVQPARPAGVAGAGRRSRAAACSVDGCRTDLTNCREYHRRHKVCEAHSKTPVVVVGGQEQRFCQQCSRFHMLPEFDKGKRSCRKRLDGHNRRRRKPQHDLTNLGGFFPYHQVNQFEVYPRIIATARQNSDAVHLVNHPPSFSISFLGDLKVPKQFLFAQDSGDMLGTACPGHLLSGTLGPKCALSPLSSSMHRPFPAVIPTKDQAQVASSVSCITAASPSTTAAAKTAFGSSGVHHVFAPDAVFEDPPQKRPFPWQ